MGYISFSSFLIPRLLNISAHTHFKSTESNFFTLTLCYFVSNTYIYKKKFNCLLLSLSVLSCALLFQWRLLKASEKLSFKLFYHTGKLCLSIYHYILYKLSHHPSSLKMLCLCQWRIKLLF